MSLMRQGQYKFKNGNDEEIVAELWLYPELDYMARFCDWDGNQAGAEWFEALCYWNQQDNKEKWENDAIDICWSVIGQSESFSAQLCEFAPFPSNVSKWSPNQNNFLTFFTWPINHVGEPMSWWNLPVRFSRFPRFDNYMRSICGWIPAAGQETAPLRSIYDMHWCWYSALGGSINRNDPIRVGRPGERGFHHFVFEDGYLESFKRRRNGRDPESRKNRQNVYSSGDRGINWRSVAELDDWTCHICGDRVERVGGTPNSRRGATMDHVIPIAEGGPHSWNNVRCAHWECNMRKSDRI